MTLSPAQAAFLAFHVARQVTAWRWRFMDTLLKAQAGRRFATIQRDELNALLEAGLMFKGAGIADVHATDAGREWVAKEKEAK